MSEQSTHTRIRILASAYELFYRGGFAKVSMNDISAAAGLTKRTLYYHFESKDDLAAAVLDYQNRLALEHIGDWGNGNSRTCAEFLQEMFRQLEEWAASPNWHGSGFTRITMELAELPGHPARLSAQNHKAALEDWLAAELAKFGAIGPRRLAKQTLLLVEGSIVLTMIHRDTSYIAMAGETAVRLAEVP